MGPSPQHPPPVRRSMRTRLRPDARVRERQHGCKRRPEACDLLAHAPLPPHTASGTPTWASNVRQEDRMSLLDQLRSLEDQVSKRITELRPAVAEFEELRKVADRLGLSDRLGLTNDAAGSHGEE